MGCWNVASNVNKGHRALGELQRIIDRDPLMPVEELYRPRECFLDMQPRCFITWSEVVSPLDAVRRNSITPKYI
jgi:hypothetical protein